MRWKRVGGLVTQLSGIHLVRVGSHETPPINRLCYASHILTEEC